MYFIGVDLAWSIKNETAITILKDGKFFAYSIELTDKEIVTYIINRIGNEGCFIGIDAPLTVKNYEGTRNAEKELTRDFRKYNAGTHPANRNLLIKYSGYVRGEQIVRMFNKYAFVEDPFTKKRENKRKIFEVYPHSSLVSYFELQKILEYKARKNRTYSHRYQEFKKYLNFLKHLNLAIPSSIIDKDVESLRGKDLKTFEDILDSIFCSFISYYKWKYPEKTKIYGNKENGHIITIKR